MVDFSQDIAESTETTIEESWQDAADVGPEVARSSWAEAARPVLLETAKRYNMVITFKELAEQVQEASGIRTKQLPTHWIGDVLGRVSADCASRGEPLLSALCVNADGSVGKSYAEAVVKSGGAEPADPDKHAAGQRLECYRLYEAAGLPSDGGIATLVPKLAASRARARKVAIDNRAIPTCPTCQMALPATGTCNYCD